MYKIVKEQPVGCKRSFERAVMFCDRCGRRINWCVPNEHGQFCNSCLAVIEKLQEKEKERL